MLKIENVDRIRTLTLNRTDQLNAFSGALYDATTEALLEAADDRNTAVVVLTGAGRAFSAGNDLMEMGGRVQPDTPAAHGFSGFIDTLVAYPKPLLVAVNGLAVGVGATMLALADLVFISSEARIRCPFTRLSVAPEAASSFTFPLLMGRQHASWVLLSSEWLSAEECVRIGLAWKVCPPDELMPTTMEHARILASKPIDSLIESKRAIVAPFLDDITAARERETGAFSRLMGTPANQEALAAFAEKREPDFAAIDRRAGA